jgi:preprotein translocase subunit SecG
MFVQNDVWLMFVLFWLFGMAMSSFTCCISVFLQTSQSASNAGLGVVLVSRQKQTGAEAASTTDKYTGT